MSVGEAGDCNPTLISPAVLYYSVDELLLLLSGEVCVRVCAHVCRFVAHM